MVSRADNAEEIRIRYVTEGAAKASRDAKMVSTSLGGVEKATRGTLLPFIGGGILSGFFAGNLAQIALAGGSAQNAMAGLSGSLERALRPFVETIIIPLIEGLTKLIDKFGAWIVWVGLGIGGVLALTAVLKGLYGAYLFLGNIVTRGALRQRMANEQMRRAARVIDAERLAQINARREKVKAAKAAKGVAVATSAQTAATRQNTKAMHANKLAWLTHPVFIIGAIIVAVIAALYLLYTRVEPVRDAINGLLNGIIDGINWVIRGLNKLPSVNIALIPKISSPRLDAHEGGFWSLRPHERDALNLLPFVNMQGGGGASTTINNFGVNPEEVNRYARQEIDSPIVRQRTAGGL